MKQLLLTGTLLFGLLTFVACTKDKPSPSSPNAVAPSGDCDTTPADFDGDVLPIVLRSCSDESNGACHQAGSPRGALVDYESINRFVQDGSFVERVIRRQDMPPSYSSNVRSLSENELDILECWIAAGAPGD